MYLSFLIIILILYSEFHVDIIIDEQSIVHYPLTMKWWKSSMQLSRIFSIPWTIHGREKKHTKRTKENKKILIKQ